MVGLEVFEIIKPFLTEESTIENWEIDLDKTFSGIIDPDGIFYPCGKFQHDTLISLLTDNDIWSFCAPGAVQWIHVYDMNPRNWSIIFCNDKQLNALWQFVKNDEQIKEFKMYIQARDGINREEK